MTYPEHRQKVTLQLISQDVGKCPYLPKKSAVFQVLSAQQSTNIDYDTLIQHGFRRDGRFLFRPQCSNCQACYSFRVDVSNFTPRRRHKRNLKQNSDLAVSLEPIYHVSAYADLYIRYQKWRHPEDSIDITDDHLNHFRRTDSSAEPQLIVARGADNNACAVSIIDKLQTGISGVYSFYEPALAKRGLGTFMVLQMHALCQQYQLPWLYLGYYVEHCRKLAYKASFSPYQLYDNERQTWFSPER